MHLSKWRGIPINSPRSYSIVNGNFDLFISSDDVSSIGSVSGILSCPLAAAEGNGYYIGDFQILHAITDSDIECDAKGSFEVTSRPAGMYRITESGTAPAELRSVARVPNRGRSGGPSAPPNLSETMRRKVATSALGGTEGDLEAWKLRMIR